MTLSVKAATGKKKGKKKPKQKGGAGESAVINVN